MENFRNLMELIAGKEQTGWENLYNEYGSRFYDYAFQRWELSEDEAWDVVYKTLETLVHKLADYAFSSQADFDRFLYRVLINFLKKQYRSKRFRESQQTVYLDFNGERQNVVDTGFSPLVQWQGTDAVSEESEHPDLARLKSVLDGFDPTEKDLLLLRAQNYSYEEIGQLLRIDTAHLKVKHHRAKQKLMKAFKTSKTNDYGTQED